MATPAPESRTQQQLLEELATELSDIRNRGIDAIERNTAKQRPLKLEVMRSVLEGSPWATETLTVGVQQIISRSIAYCDRQVTRDAARAFYGLGEHQDRSKDEKEKLGLEALSVPTFVSGDYRKTQIRKVRQRLARAILKAAANNFALPGPDDDGDDSPLPDLTKEVLTELRQLTEGYGVRPTDFDTRAPTILKLDAVRDHFLHSNDADDLAGCAIAVLRCTTRLSTMSDLHRGKLVAEMLNLRQTTDLYDARRASYLEVSRLTVERFTELETQAFVLFAKTLVDLDHSPCLAGGDQVPTVIDFGPLSAVLSQLAMEVNTRSFEARLRRLEEALPALQHANGGGQDSRAPMGGWFMLLLNLVRAEYAEWVRQYLRRIDRVEEFLEFEELAQILTAPMGSPAKAREERQDVADRYMDNYLSVAGREVSARQIAGKFDTAQHFAGVLRNSITLLAQLFAYNEKANYWEAANDLNRKTRGTAIPKFPIVPIKDSDRAAAVAVAEADW